MTAALDDPLLGWPLPVDDPADAARTADGLVASADRLGTLVRRLGAMLPVQSWSGVASDAADRRLALTALALGWERSRLLRAAEVLSDFSRQVAAARAVADEASRLVAVARQAQDIADRRDVSMTGSRSTAGWGNVRADGTIYDPYAVALLDQARERAHEARTTYDRAARRLAAELMVLSGRRVVRAGLSPRMLLDVAGFVPVIGDAIDVVNALVYLKQRRWGDALLTGAAAVPGPLGWWGGGAKIGKAVDHAGDIERVVDDGSTEARAAEILNGLTTRGRRRTTRMLPDDESIESLYRELEPLGLTELRAGTRGDVFVTAFPSGARVTFRGFSESEGFAIEIYDLPGVSMTLIHRPRH